MSLTVPQIQILEKNLEKILKAEAGEGGDVGDVGGDSTDGRANMENLGYVTEMLKEKTGRSTFTYNEILNPAATIAKYKKE